MYIVLFSEERDLISLEDTFFMYLWRVPPDVYYVTTTCYLYDPVIHVLWSEKAI